jgi:hypothetical protein
MEAPYETLLVNRLAEITNNSIAQGADSLAVVGAASNEDCENGVPHIDKVWLAPADSERAPGSPLPGAQDRGDRKQATRLKMTCRQEHPPWLILWFPIWGIGATAGLNGF